MNLQTYLDTNAIAPAKFAGSINVTPTALGRYLSGDRIPRPDVLRRIVSETQGKVQPNDFFPFAGKKSV